MFIIGIFGGNVTLCLPSYHTYRELFSAAAFSFYRHGHVPLLQYEDDGFVTRGWWTVGPNQCANVVREELRARYIYIFAQDVFGNEILNGTKPLCIEPKRFVIEGERNCVARGYLDVKYLEVDTQETERWTLFLAAPP